MRRIGSTPRMAGRLLSGVLFAFFGSMADAQEPCAPGAYGIPGEFVVISQSKAGAGWRYVFLDGRRGDASAVSGPVSCAGSSVVVRRDGNASETWQPMSFRSTDAEFSSDGTQLKGQLVEPVTPSDGSRPLVVLVHGSEKTAAIGGQLPYVFAAQGIAVFVYDKRGTGASGGDYTQNFELLADDAAAALTTARSIAKGRYDRAGFYGGSQGGWVAPLAATRSRADFVAVGFGLVVSPIEEDHEQLQQEGRAAGLDAKGMADVDRLSNATAALVSSHFESGFEWLETVRREVAATPWAAGIEGEYSGDIMRMNDADLHRVGRARFDALGLIWNYDALAALRRLKVPLLWVLAGEDREAPIADTRAALSRLITEHRRVDAFVFPETDHGMMEFTVTPHGQRMTTRVTDGYFRLVADWIKGRPSGRYGRAERIDPSTSRRENDSTRPRASASSVERG